MRNMEHYTHWPNQIKFCLVQQLLETMFEHIFQNKFHHVCSKKLPSLNDKNVRKIFLKSLHTYIKSDNCNQRRRLYAELFTEFKFFFKLTQLVATTLQNLLKQLDKTR